MPIVVKPIKTGPERWMRIPTTPRDLFVFSGYADFTGGGTGVAITGQGPKDDDEQNDWVEFDVVQIRVGPHWLRIDGVCPTVVIGGHSQLAPDSAHAMGFRVTGVTAIDLVEDSAGIRRIELSVNVVVRGGYDGSILTLAYQVTAWGGLAAKMGNEGSFFAGATDPT